MKKKLLFAGHSGIGIAGLAILEVLGKDHDIVMVDDVKDIPIPEIMRFENPYKDIMEITPYSLNDSDYESRPRRLRSDINIAAEYRLICEKKSKLSRWERDKVVSIMESK